MKDVFYLRSSASCTSVCGSRSRTGSRTPDAATRRGGAAAQPVADSPPCRRRAADSSSSGSDGWTQRGRRRGRGASRPAKDVDPLPVRNLGR